MKAVTMQLLVVHLLHK